MSAMTVGDRFRGGLWGMFIGDALAMPVHWYYDVAALPRDFGTIRDYQAPKDFHPGSIMSLASDFEAALIVLKSTHKRALDDLPLEDLEKYQRP